MINDGTYRVIASVYPKKEDAEIVISRMISEGKAATVYEIKGAAVKYDKSAHRRGLAIRRGILRRSVR